MATNALDPHAASHADHHHDHPKFLAHHFDTPEQQYDSGKLGIWLFLVTEVLFFSGMFCAYAIFRSYRPDVFQFSSEFLNTTLGAINTTVLLFSSLTMAWAVRSAQLEQHKTTALMITITLCCATIFLGVKSVEYSHKWNDGLNPGALYDYGTSHAGSDANFLAMLCAVPLLLVIGVVGWYIKALMDKNTYQRRVAGPLVFVALSFFLGVGLGYVLVHAESHDSSHGSHAAAEHGAGEADISTHQVAADPASPSTSVDQPAPATVEPAAPAITVTEADALVTVPEEAAVLERLAKEQSNSGIRSALEARERQAMLANSTEHVGDPLAESSVDAINKASQNRLAATFFGIYYCMTGIHALHIIGGIVVLVWLLARAVREDFTRQYFGPVDYVGLYWHLVDLIWIYLFPLLYLIR